MSLTTQTHNHALQILQDAFAIANLNGKFYGVENSQVKAITSGCSNESLTLLEKRDAELAMKRLLESSAVASNPKKVIPDFWVNPSTRVYRRVAFDPRDNGPDILNLWCPSPIKPLSCDWHPLYYFLNTIICNGDELLFDYLIKFLAHALRHPSDKPGIVIVLLGGQGVGKGVFFKLLRRLWPTTCLMVSDVKQVVGGFNAALESKYIVTMDEAIFVGDRGSTERLKSMVTEEQIVVEDKYQPRRSIRSIHRFFAASNAEHFSQVDRDDRRFLFLRVSSVKQGDFDYFENLVKAIDDEVVLSGFVDSLMRLNLTGFNVRQRPKTPEHATQILKSLGGFERFWFEVLLMGDLRGRDRPVANFNGFSQEVWDEARFAPTKLLVTLFTDFDTFGQRYGAAQQAELHRQLGRLCPSSKPNRRHHGPMTSLNEREQVRGFDLPSLEVARAEFCNALGVLIDWDTGAAIPLNSSGKDATTDNAIVADYAWWDATLLNGHNCMNVPAAAQWAETEGP